MSQVKGDTVTLLSGEEQLKLQRKVARLEKENDALEEEKLVLESSYKERIAELLNIWTGVSRVQLEEAKKDADRRAMESINDAMKRLTTVRSRAAHVVCSSCAYRWSKKSRWHADRQRIARQNCRRTNLV